MSALDKGRLLLAALTTLGAIACIEANEWGAALFIAVMGAAWFVVLGSGRHG